MDIDPAEDKADHTLVVLAAAIDPIFQLSSESDSEYGGQVYMVGQDGQPLEKTAKEIQWDVEEDIAHAERLARELNKRKGHNSQ
jgi:hypothetical protein